jgi:hypothetical protein
VLPAKNFSATRESTFPFCSSLALPAKSPEKTRDYTLLPEKTLVLPAKNFSATRESAGIPPRIFSATRENSAARALAFRKWIQGGRQAPLQEELFRAS